MSLIGTWVVCTATVWLQVPQLNKILPQTSNFTCEVIDDRFMSVGTPDDKKSMYIVDCSQDPNYKMLARDTIGIFLYEKGECNE